MRRSITMLVIVGLLGTTFLGSASAGLPKVRRDPNDVVGDLDIRAIRTHVTFNRLVLRIRMWDRHPWAGTNGFVVVPMDTHGGEGSNREVYIYKERCRASTSSGRRRFIGRRPSRQPTEHTISCRLPLRWFNIDKKVRFAVYGLEYDSPFDIDRAPDEKPRMFRGLERMD